MLVLPSGGEILFLVTLDNHVAVELVVNCFQHIHHSVRTHNGLFGQTLEHGLVQEWSEFHGSVREPGHTGEGIAVSSDVQLGMCIRLIVHCDKRPILHSVLKASDEN